jgi:hypothetical protein
VGKANGSRECAPDDELRVPTTINASADVFLCGGHGARAPLPTLQSSINRKIDMTNFIKAAGLAGILVAALAAVPELKADQPDDAVREGHAVTTELGGNAAAVTYWVSKSDGCTW